MYSEIFSTGMKNHWQRRVYLDLFAGSGHAVIRGSRRRVLTSPLLALDVPDRFDRYVFCDEDAERLSALKTRVARMAPAADAVFMPGDANATVDEIAAHIPQHGKGNTVLSFCFIDPYGLDIHFETIRRLGSNRAMDFLILLALRMDANRNWATYLQPSSDKVTLFLGDPTWRPRWTVAEQHGHSPTRFLAEEYAAAMTQLGYLTTGLDRMIEVKTYDNNMPLYYLAFFSKSARGDEFWDEVRKYSTDQLGLDV
jgi:three-Cys-motif partner protein